MVRLHVNMNRGGVHHTRCSAGSLALCLLLCEQGCAEDGAGSTALAPR
jgi:hypothetical protein